MRVGTCALALVIVTAIAVTADGGVVRGAVQVSRPPGLPASPIVVYVVGFTEPSPRAAVVVQQLGKRFLPDLIIATAGGTVSFPNGDPFLHNVFSPTSERTFDLGSFPHGETRTRTFPRTGVIDIYCNIHPEMSATLVVLPNTRFAIADASGRFEIAGVPPGTWKVFAYSRRAARPSSVSVTVGDGSPVEATLSLEEAPREFTHRNKFGETYRATTIYRPGT